MYDVCITYHDDIGQVKSYLFASYDDEPSVDAVMKTVNGVKLDALTTAVVATIHHRDEGLLFMVERVYDGKNFQEW